MKISIIAIILSFSAMGYGQAPADTTAKADTIQLSPAHQQLLPELLKQQAELQREMQSIQDKIMILLTGYVDPKDIQGGKVQFSQDQKSIIIR